MKLILIFFISSVLFFACVPARQFEEIKKKYDQCNELNSNLTNNNRKLEEIRNEQKAKIEDLNKRLTALIADTTVIGRSLRQMTKNYDKLNETYELLLEKNRELLSGNEEETKKLMGKLQDLQEMLQKKEDNLRELEKTLNEKEKRLINTNNELIKREKRVKELENIINKKDSTVKSIKNKLYNALLGYKDEGLSIKVKDGKIYVSLEEKLLFKSGSYVVDKKGIQALKKLGKVLENHRDVDILIEGHTDNVPYKGNSYLLDNWDLSVKRATSIARILISNSTIDPKRIIAAGKGEYDPVAPNDTPENKAKNRRTEVILIPKLEEIFQIIQSDEK